MRYILLFAAIMAMLTAHARAVEPVFVVENKIAPSFVVVNKSGPAGAAKKVPFVPGTSTRVTTVRVVESKDSKPASSGDTSPGATTTPAPLMGLAGGTTTGNCANGNCPTSTGRTYLIRRR